MANGLCWMALVVLLSACGLGGSADPDGVERRSEVVYETEDGLEGAVEIDSLVWRPSFYEFGVGGEVLVDEEVEGVFAARFRNLRDERLQVRYDLRFMDADEFLIDAFIPFGQPVVLEAGEVRRVEGAFRIRVVDARDLERLVLMRLVARVRRPE